MSIRHWIRRTLGLIGLAAAAGLASGNADAASARPALWEVADKDTRIYLFGTIHMLPANTSWYTKKLDKALGRSDGLVVETLIDPRNPAPLMAELARLGVRAGLPPLADRVPPDKRSALALAVARSGVPVAAFDRMETWAAAMTLLSAQFRALDLKGEQGVEAILKEAFRVKGKPIGQLETNGEQLGYFDRLSEAAQRELLVSAIDAPQSMRSEFNAMLDSWVRGDTAAIARSFNSDLSRSPELLDALLGQRNLVWARWIERRMAQPGSVMVAVGAGHLAGASSVQAILQQQGYKVRRIQ